LFLKQLDLVGFKSFAARTSTEFLPGIVVVVAAGNAGPGAPITAPANDPFVISVGATDDMATATTTDDRLAAFSSYGTTVDGIRKPDLVAPGRHIVSTLSSRQDALAVRFAAAPEQANHSRDGVLELDAAACHRLHLIEHQALRVIAHSQLCQELERHADMANDQSIARDANCFQSGAGQMQNFGVRRWA